MIKISCLENYRVWQHEVLLQDSPIGSQFSDGSFPQPCHQFESGVTGQQRGKNVLVFFSADSHRIGNDFGRLFFGNFGD